MTDNFAYWQPRYAEAGIPLFPIEGKMPLVKNYTRMGAPATTALVARFAAVEAFGFACGRRSRLTVLDFDTTDERVITEVLDAAGPTPIMIRTHSGKLHAWYRHAGEGRHLRINGLRIDALGEGLAVAPPSRGAKGAYEFIQGSLDDVASLPVMKLTLPASLGTDQGRPVHDRASTQDRILEGQRDYALFRYCMQRARSADPEALLEQAHDYNRECLHPPLSPAQVRSKVRSALRYEAEGKNWYGKPPRLTIPFADIDELLQDAPDAFILLTILRRQHEGLREHFCVANAMAAHMPGKPWSPPRFAKARTALERHGYIAQMRHASRANGAAIYGFAYSDDAV